MEGGDWHFLYKLEMAFSREWTSMLRGGVPPVQKREWLALYREDGELRRLVLKASFKHAQVVKGETLSRPSATGCYIVGIQSGALHLDMELTTFLNSEGELNASDPWPHGNWEAPRCTLTNVQVVLLTQGEKETKSTTLLFYGPLHCLTMDPKWFQWSDGSHLQDYSAKKGRTFLRNRAPAWDLAKQKWSGNLPPRYSFRWDAL